MCTPSPVIPVVEVETVHLAITPLAPPEVTPFPCDDDLVMENWVTTVSFARIQVLAAYQSTFQRSRDEVVDDMETVLRQYRLLLQAGVPECGEEVNDQLINVLWQSMGMLQAYGNGEDRDYATMRGELELELDAIIEDALNLLIID
ncbi:hypothetical protein G4Y79_15080 [Phototrophicus methaneseepsis]|uniref:Uncharacterized protein n=1 Tax=Phototrophicus methaneseepsis TaxID=2710758 RepID=A0A7S8E605_9CHLR|nr:hypothetical protein [Phototrophicus methaneseepsis]QPC81026.1 hypothetical protein G4Y79_15080 [Phototrophicus methaneseepsis]